MSWFNRKKKVDESSASATLPELPELPESTNKMIFEGNEITEPELPELPEFETSSLPDLPSSQNQIKQAINQKTNNQEMQKSRFAPLPQSNQYEEKSARGVNIIKKTIPSLTQSQQYKQTRPLQTQTTSKKPESIYIKLDKFETSLQALEEIKDRITDIEKLLAKTREIKAQEEKELEDWERELNIIKQKLDSIDKTVFKDLQ